MCSFRGKQRQGMATVSQSKTHGAVGEKGWVAPGIPPAKRPVLGRRMNHRFWPYHLRLMTARSAVRLTQTPLISTSHLASTVSHQDCSCIVQKLRGARQARQQADKSFQVRFYTVIRRMDMIGRSMILSSRKFQFDYTKLYWRVLGIGVKYTSIMSNRIMNNQSNHIIIITYWSQARVQVPIRREFALASSNSGVVIMRGRCVAWLTSTYNPSESVWADQVRVAIAWFTRF